jgi:hypothetical protein
MHPSASGGTVVQLPPKAPNKVTMDRGGGPISQPQKGAPVNDLLDGGNQVVKTTDATAQITDFFDSVAISSPPSGATSHIDANPFNTFAPVPVAVSNSATPTIAQLPMTPPASAHVQVQHQGPVTHFGSPPGAAFPYQQGHAPPPMVHQNHIGQPPGHVSQGTYANTPPPSQYPSPSGTYPGPPSTYQTTTVPPQSQRPPSSSLSQFDPFAKR